MTSCLIVKSPTRLVAVADGRLSRDDNTPSFNSTRKLSKFPIGYRIPVFAHGRVERYRRYESSPWFLAYAGTHNVAFEIIDLFRQQLESLRLVRHEVGRHAVLAHEIDTSRYYDDDYNFDRDEYPKLEARNILEELKEAFEKKGSEFSANRRERSDIQFLLFGNEETSGKYMAYRVYTDQNGFTPGERLRIRADPVDDGVLTSIGSQAVANAADADRELMDGIAEWTKDGGVDVLWGEFGGWGTGKVASRFCDIIRSTDDPSVGGTLIVAVGDWGKPLDTETVEP